TTPLFGRLNKRASHMRARRRWRRRRGEFHLLVAHHALKVTPSGAAIEEPAIEVGVVIDQVDESDLGVAQLDATAFAFTIDDLQLGNPINAIREPHGVAAVLLNHFSPQSNGVYLVARQIPNF